MSRTVKEQGLKGRQLEELVECGDCENNPPTEVSFLCARHSKCKPCDLPVAGMGELRWCFACGTCAGCGNRVSHHITVHGDFGPPRCEVCKIDALTIPQGMV